jgi:hypothetical protein
LNQAGVYGTLQVAAASNFPGGRSAMSIVYDATTKFLYLFGGLTPSGALNDVWRFNTLSKVWAWLSGSNQISQLGSYESSNFSMTQYPGSRSSYAISMDSSAQVFYVFGGFGWDTAVTGTLCQKYSCYPFE